MDTHDGEDEIWETNDAELHELKDDLESLTRLEKIAHKRQEQIEHRIEGIADDGVPKSRIRGFCASPSRPSSASLSSTRRRCTNVSG